MASVLHFGLACQDHVVHVVAYGEPAFTDPGIQALGFGERDFDG